VEKDQNYVTHARFNRRERKNTMEIFNQEKYKNTESSEEGGKLFSIIENWEMLT
jgi:hypothetical protein